MRVVRTVAEARAVLAEAQGWSGRIGLVPTMGAFHDGHRALMRAARHETDVVTVSVFVNPAQFGPGEDFERYPRQEGHDIAAADAEGVDILFAPRAAELYPPGFDTWVEPGELGRMLEGAARPGHFRGVATVCAKLFAIVRPHVAYFGRKDAQQVAVIRRMVADLDLELEVATAPTVRDADGLALSSRNVFLAPAEREIARCLPRALEAGLAAHRAGGDPVAAANDLLGRQPSLTVDYVAVADFDGPTLAAAIRVGTTRLIDNVLLTQG